MTSFAFIPRALRNKKPTEEKCLDEKGRSPYPPGLILKITFTRSNDKDASLPKNATAITSFLEHLVPRSVRYVQLARIGEDKVQTQIRASSAENAKHLRDRLSSSPSLGVHLQESYIVQGEEEALFWSKLPDRIRNRVQTQVAKQRVRRRRGGQKRKRKSAMN